MKKNITFVGLDVHKNSIDVALADAGRDGDVRFYGSIGGDLESLHKVLRKLQSSGTELRFAYEAGPCGYDIYRFLINQGFDCIVVAPSKIPRKSGDRIKNDRRDALNLARLHRSGDLTEVYVPSTEDEAMRDLTRGREDSVKALRVARQVLFSLPAPTWISLQRPIVLDKGSQELDRRHQDATPGTTNCFTGIRLFSSRAI